MPAWFRGEVDQRLAREFVRLKHEGKLKERHNMKRKKRAVMHKCDSCFVPDDLHSLALCVRYVRRPVAVHRDIYVTCKSCLRIMRARKKS